MKNVLTIGLTDDNMEQGLTAENMNAFEAFNDVVIVDRHYAQGNIADVLAKIAAYNAWADKDKDKSKKEEDYETSHKRLPEADEEDLPEFED